MNTERSQQATPSALIKIAEAAHELAISERSLWRLISSGKLDVVRIGRSVRIKRDSLARFIAGGGEAR